MALVVSAGDDGDVTVPEASSLPTQQASPMPWLPTAAEDVVEAKVVTEPALALPAPVASAAARLEPLQLQRNVQRALSSDRPGLAGVAAQSIGACLSLEALEPAVRGLLEEQQREKPSASYGEAVSHMNQWHAGCQGLDAAARAQFEPLIWRSLKEGDRGAAAVLVWHLDKAFDPARDPDVVAALKRDAWACDLDSVAALDSLSDRHPHLLARSEWAAIGRLARSRPMLGWAWRPLQIASTPSGDAFAAEVDGIIAVIQASCVKHGQRP
ncbi:hypothetical protein [Roseateles asaccharophilus]|uniref:hypothetical protein n=1 Tax=Roseateles asaccharophilus TaxID=582607 RepID=UPI00286CBD3A|nr:hypothetical protein [Roseateles asaccharophilus]